MDERQAAVDRLEATEREAREREIDAEVEAERERKAQAAAAEAEQKRQACLRSEISVEVEKWLQALGEAEDGAVKMTSALRAAFLTASKINSQLAALGTPARIGNLETADRLSRRIAVLMSGIDQAHAFGHFTLHAHLITDPDASWPASELKYSRWLETLKETNR